MMKPIIRRLPGILVIRALRLCCAALVALNIGGAWSTAQTSDSLTGTTLPSVFSGDGALFASADASGRITVLNLGSGEEVVTLNYAEPISALAFSPDGQTIASTAGNRITLSRLSSNAESVILEEKPGSVVTRIRFGPDGKSMATISDRAEVSLWSIGENPQHTRLSQLEVGLDDLAFSPDGKFLAASGSGSNVTLWDLSDRRVPATLSSPTGAIITGMAFSPVENLLAVSDEDANIALWNADSHEEKLLPAHMGWVKRLRFSPDGEVLASEGSDSQLFLWNVASGQHRAVLTARFDERVTGLAFSPDGSTLASVGAYSEVYLWDVPSGILSQVLTGHTGQVNELAFDASGQRLASVDVEGKVIVWNLQDGTTRFSLAPSPSPDSSTNKATDAEVSPDAELQAKPASPALQSSTNPSDLTGSETEVGAASTSVSAADRPRPPSAQKSRKIKTIAVSADGKKVAALYEKGLVNFSVDSSDDLTEVSADSFLVASAITFSPDGEALYSGGRNSEVRRNSAVTGVIEQIYRAHEHPIRAIDVSPGGGLVASAGEETRIMVWSSKGKLQQILSAHRGFVNTLVFAPKKNRLQLASGGDDGMILIWNPKQREPIRALLGHAGAINTLTYSKNGEFLASGGEDTTVKLWNPATGLQVASLNHGSPVHTIAVSGNSRYLAAAGNNGVISIWDLKRGGTLVHLLGGGRTPVTSLKFLKGNHLLVASEDGTLTLWELVKKQKIRAINVAPNDVADEVHYDSRQLPAVSEQTGSKRDLPDESLPDLAEPGLLLKIAGTVLQWLIPSAHAQELPPPNRGSGGPILIVSSDASLFGDYYSEILLNEGFNAFAITDIAGLTPFDLAGYEVLILAQMTLLPAQVTMLSDWVNAGGNLIAMHPDPGLAALLGLTATSQSLAEGYLLVDTSTPPGAGIAAQTMQFHGIASRFDLNGASSVATLYSDAATPTTHPAVTLRDVGSNGGQAVAFAYDLATSIIYTRQGNPAWANQERDGFAPQRSDDKYFGSAAGDPQLDWVDLNKVAIPQADEQQRLLTNLILHITRDQTPLPRFWYFPRGEKAVVIMTGDDHGNGGTAGRWDQFLAASPAGCSVQNWECVRGTSYLYPSTPFTDAQASVYEAQGFEVGLHINTGCSDFSEMALDDYYAQQIAAFRASWPSTPPPSTERHHCIAWTDWVTAAKVQSSYGIRLDTSYYFWPPGWVQNRSGFMNGSGMPMRFADLDGTVLDIYQAATQMTDESGQQYPFTVDSLLDRALGVEGYYGAYVVNAHTDLPQIPESDAVLASAQARDVPIISSRQMLEWLDGRNGSSFGSIAWDGVTLSFTVATGAGANGLQTVVPMYRDSGVVIGVSHDSASIPFTVITRKGVDYASFNTTDGAYTVSYGVDTSAPTVISMLPLSGAEGVAVDTAVSAVFSEPMDAASINGTTFQLLDTQGIPVGATVTYDEQNRTATLTPAGALLANASYGAQLISGGPADIFGNTLAGEIIWTFTTGAALDCPCSVWDESDTPATASAADPGAVELGVKLQSESDGYITGIRFYKGSGNTGTHVGNLWTTTGTLLATATFRGETDSGWQQVDFPLPVPIAANTVYVASYYAPNGGYAVNTSHFAAASIDKPPLRFLSNGESGGNGVYRYGTSGFPNQSWNSSNYWVDVVFDTNTGPDSTPPAISSMTPVNGATDVAVDTAVTATFSEAIDEATINAANFELRDAGGTIVPAGIVYDGVAKTAILTPTTALDASASYVASVNGGAGGVVDLAGNTLPADVSWSFTTAAGDTTAPTVTSTSPIDGATGVSAAASITASFDEAIDPATVNSDAFELRDPSGTLVAGSVSYNAATRTATLVPLGALASGAVFTATLTSGPTGMTDSSGNALAADVIWSFTTAPAGSGVCATPCSLWDAAATPNLLTDPDTSAVELGVKFRSDVAAFVTGVRFYKGPQNTGSHVGSLWSSTGQLLAQATFSNETVSGWQQVDFAEPVAVQADTVYVVSYHTTVGKYSVDNGYFISTYSNGPLQAVADGANGVYLYGPGGFPSNSYNSSNYWVDVVVSTSAGPDTSPPTIVTTTPVGGAVNVSPGSSVTAVFSEPMDAATITHANFTLTDEVAANVSATVSYDAPTMTAVLTPDTPLALGSQYIARVAGGEVGVSDVAGNPQLADVTWIFTTATSDTCLNPANAIVAENCLAGNPAAQWEVTGAGDPSIQGFAADISVNVGDTVQFKIDTDAGDYRLDIYRLGYYGGDGARKITTVQPSVTLPQSQPACLEELATGLIDCGNWATSASWTVPANATSGIYLARAVRADTGGASHIVFVVRDDTSSSDVLFQTSDTTWQAYNNYGGNSLYGGTGPGGDGRAYKVSYNRPFNTRSVDGGQDWLFSSEYPLVRWLEANGYDISYFTGVDSDRRGALIQNHRVFLSVGHDEYWSGQQRSNVEAARDASVHLAFLSGNEIFWKTRWEDSIDASGTSHRTLVCYKETHDYPNSQDPADPSTWTGTWRDPRNSPPADGGRPENALSGTIFMVNEGATTRIQVPEADGKMRFWRNTSIATQPPGQTAFLPNATLGYEWDEDLDNGFRPSGLIRLSTTTVANAPVLTDHGSTYASASATHHLTLYRADSGALVFGAGTVQWSWGLDQNYDDTSGLGGDPADPRMQQAMVNLLADMDTQPATLQVNLVPATGSTDTTAPGTVILSPAAGTTVPQGAPLTISGSATDSGGGAVGGVEVSVDGGTTWHPATGRANWSYQWLTPPAGSATIRARAVDDSGNIEYAGPEIIVSVGGGGGDTTPPTIDATVPADNTVAVDTASPVLAIFSEAMDAATITVSSFELRDASSALITASVSYDVSGNTATLTPSVALTPATTYTVTIKGGAGGVADMAGNTLFADESWSFTTTVDDTTAPTVTSTFPIDGATGVSPAASVTASFDESIDPATVDSNAFELRDPGGTLVAGLVSYNGATRTATLAPVSALASDAVYTAALISGPAGVTDSSGNTLAADVSWSFTTAPEGSGVCATPCSLWDAVASPSLLTDPDTSAVELGVKFRSDVAGFVTGVRFYKGPQNTGSHVGSLWSSTGQLLAQATFSNETASGWQQVDFSSPVAIQANTVYVASYHTTVGRYSVDSEYFTSAYSNGPLQVVADGTNGVYLYGPGGFPNNTYNLSNYWVDVVVATSVGAGMMPP